MFQKGHIREIKIAGGTLTFVSFFNPMDLVGEERRLVFEIVDLVETFEASRAQPDPGDSSTRMVLG